MNIKPGRNLPGPIFAVMYGESIRCEYVSGEGDLIIQNENKKFWIMTGQTPKCDFYSPTKVVVLTHLQNKCKFGIFFSPWPFQFHFWWHWKLQEYKLDDNNVLMRIPNSERGIYFRLPGWRWDIEEGMKFTGGRIPGAHWD